MFQPYRTAAAAKFAALQKLDAFAVERAELAAAGVAHNRVEVLYPAAFTTIAAELGAHLPPEIENHRLITSAGFLIKIGTPVVNSTLNGAKNQGTVAKVVAEFEAGEPARLKLKSIIQARVKPAYNPVYWVSPASCAETVADACWWAWWAMRNRAALPWRLQRRTDELMFTVGDLFELR